MLQCAVLRTITFCSLLILIAVGIAVGNSADAAMIRLKSTAKVTTTVIRLGDVADVLDADPATVERLKLISLAPAPAPGGKKRLDFSMIRSRLLAQGVDLAVTEFSGRSVVTVSNSKESAKAGNRNSVQSMTSDEVKYLQRRAQREVTKAIQRYLKRVAPDLGSVSLSVRIPREEAASVLNGRISGYEVRGGRPPWNQPQEFMIRFLDRTDQLREVSVMCRVVPHPLVIAVKLTVPRGHVLQESDLVWRQAAIADESLFSRAEDVLGREATRTIRRDQPIRTQDIRNIPLIRTNRIVTVYSRRPGIRVQRQLKARTDGAIGELVTLVTLDGRQKVQAVVTGLNEAEILRTGRFQANATANFGGGIRLLTRQPQPGISSNSTGSISPRR